MLAYTLRGVALLLVEQPEVRRSLGVSTVTALLEEVHGLRSVALPVVEHPESRCSLGVSTTTAGLSLVAFVSFFAVAIKGFSATIKALLE